MPVVIVCFRESEFIKIFWKELVFNFSVFERRWLKALKGLNIVVDNIFYKDA